MSRSGREFPPKLLSLQLKPGPMDEAHIAIICREILEGLVYLHRQTKVSQLPSKGLMLDTPRYKSS